MILPFCLLSATLANNVFVFAHPRTSPSNGKIMGEPASMAGDLIYRPSQGNLTNSTALQARKVTCLTRQHFDTPVTHTDCKSTIQAIREFPLYRTRQTFIEDPPYHSVPIVPGYGGPPFGIQVRGSVCAIAVTTMTQKFSSVFRWYDVRQAAETILDECEHTGFGGVIDVGPSEGSMTWTVTIVGKPAGPPVWLSGNAVQDAPTVLTN